MMKKYCSNLFFLKNNKFFLFLKSEAEEKEGGRGSFRHSSTFSIIFSFIKYISVLLHTNISINKINYWERTEKFCSIVAFNVR